ncbi:putative unc-13 (Munc13) [Fasciolopsis buskii]|uniref:Putative unc-13 (Munc13) n=1 Tax=Fasciolopsis buskii TaxID=27845 RepID=A0A8E0RWR8_9TREM|nr:putative unc-13 (Munc13) [Fasciolopsis buski]
MSRCLFAVIEAKLEDTDSAVNTFVSVKLKLVQSNTQTKKGTNPRWDEEFTFEIEQITGGLLLELHSKGLLWNKLLGALWLPLKQIPQMNITSTMNNHIDPQVWSLLNAEVIFQNGVPIGTKTPTKHSLLTSIRFEVPNGKICILLFHCNDFTRWGVCLTTDILRLTNILRD